MRLAGPISAVLALLSVSTARTALASDVETPQATEDVVQRAVRDGAMLPMTLLPNVGDASAIAAGYSGYDGARRSARLQTFAEARLFGPLALRVGAQSRNVGESVSPSVMARAQLLTQSQHGVDGAVALAYKAEGFSEPEGEVEVAIMLARSLGNWRLLGDLVYGQDPEGAERDGELRAAAFHTFAARYSLGLDARGRFDLGSRKSKLLQPAEPRFDLDAGPALMVAWGPFSLGAHTGLSLFNGRNAPIFALAGVGTAL